MRVLLYFSYLFLVLISDLLVAQVNINVAAEAVLGKLVVMQINGKREQLRVGETKGKVKVTDANTSIVTLNIDGEVRKIKVGVASVRSNYSQSKKIERISRNAIGMYEVVGTINNRSANFLVDTGATFVSLSLAHAKRLGIDYKTKGRLVQMSTANGVAPAYFIKLDTVSVGGITIDQVEGVVMAGAGMPEILLGMSFLNRVDVSYKAGIMTLESQ